MDLADISPGDHITYFCGPHFHHGIYCGDVPHGNILYKDVVVHLEGKHKGGIVREISYEKFATGQEIDVVQYQALSYYDPDVVIRRAISKLNEPGYNLLSNNCEHFARWCKTGKNVSPQIEDATTVGYTIVGVAGTLVTALVIPELIVGIGISAGAVYIGENLY